MDQDLPDAAAYALGKRFVCTQQMAVHKMTSWPPSWSVTSNRKFARCIFTWRTPVRRDRPNKKNKIITPSQHKKSHKIIKSHHISCIAAVSSIHFLSWVFRACLLLLVFISLQVFRCKAIDLSVLMIAGGKPNVYERHESMLAVVSMRMCGH